MSQQQQPKLPDEILALMAIVDKMNLSNTERYGVNQAFISIIQQLHELKTLKDIEKSRIESDQTKNKEVKNAGRKQD